MAHRRRAGTVSPAWTGPARLAVGFYFLARLWQLVMIGAPVVAADTSMYRYEGQGWFDFVVVSFSGSDLRPWPVTLLYAVTPSDQWRVFAQFAVATCCWGYCICQFRHLTAHRALSVAGPAAVATLALTIGVSGFDVVLLSESLALSLVALFVGGILSLSFDRLRLPTLTATFAAASMLGLLRPVLIPLVACVAVIPCVAWFREQRAGAARPMLTVLAAASVLAVGASTAYALAYNVRSDKAWGDWRGAPGTNGRTLTQYYLAAYHTPFGPELVRAMVAAGAPACIDHASPTDEFATDHLAIDQARCPDGVTWLSDHFLPATVRYLATNPAAARRYLRDALRDAGTLRSEGERSLPTLVPSAVTSLIFSEKPGGGDPLVLWSILAAGLLVARWQRLRRPGPSFLSSTATPDRRASPMAIACIGATLVVAYAALLGTAVLSATDASRVALPVTALLRLVLLVVLLRAGARVLTGPAPEPSERLPPPPSRRARTGRTAAAEPTPVTT